ncbi:MAG: hypothetical protein IJR63_01395 [Synergistaceae bacterium]|nr:hypothetical protein [Synergistaceae bacterium]
MRLEDSEPAQRLSHKKSYRLAEDYDAVCIETLNMRAMSHQLKFGKHGIR